MLIFTPYNKALQYSKRGVIYCFVRNYSFVNRYAKSVTKMTMIYLLFVVVKMADVFRRSLLIKVMLRQAIRRVLLVEQK